MNQKFNVFSALETTGKVIFSVAGALVVGQSARMAYHQTKADVKIVGATVKEFKDPTPILVKEKGLFGKKHIVKVNPLTGKMDAYTGTRKPINKKAIKLF